MRSGTLLTAKQAYFLVLLSESAHRSIRRLMIRLLPYNQNQNIRQHQLFQPLKNFKQWKKNSFSHDLLFQYHKLQYFQRLNILAYKEKQLNILNNIKKLQNGRIDMILNVTNQPIMHYLPVNCRNRHYADTCCLQHYMPLRVHWDLHG